MVCPAPCEAACVLAINDQAVTIKQIEWEISRRGWERGLDRARQAPGAPHVATRSRWWAPVPRGSPPPSSSTAPGTLGDGLREERAHRGPAPLWDPGVQAREVGRGPPTRAAPRGRRGVSNGGARRRGSLGWRSCAAASTPCCSAMGSRRQPRDLPIEGRGAGRRPLRHGVPHPAEQATRRRRRTVSGAGDILAGDKHVIVVLGGGDTGSDCVGTSHRQKCDESVTSVELLERPPDERLGESTPWPLWPLVFRTSSSSSRRAVTARLLRADEAFLAARRRSRRRRWTRRARALRRARRVRDAPAMEEIPGSEFSRCPRTSCCSPWASYTRFASIWSKTSGSSSTRAETSRPTLRELHHQRARRLRRRRLPPRSVPGGLGPVGGPGGGPRRRRLPDGRVLAPVAPVPHLTALCSPGRPSRWITA